MDSFKSNHPLQPHSSTFHNPLPWAHKSKFTNLISYPEFQTPANSFISSTWKLLCKQVAFPAKPNNAHSSEVQGSEVLILNLVMRDGKLECGELLWTWIEVEGSLKQASKKQFELPALSTCCCIYCSSNRRNVSESVGPLWTIPQIAQKKTQQKVNKSCSDSEAAPNHHGAEDVLPWFQLSKPSNKVTWRFKNLVRVNGT